MIQLRSLLTEEIKARTALDYISNLIQNSPYRGKVFVAGGYVRDELLGLPSKDVDLVITDPNGGIEFANWLTQRLGVHSQSNPIVYPRFGTAKFNLRGIKYQGVDLSDLDIEAVMTRTETYTDGSRKPDVEYGTLKQDAERRDFTVNSLMKDLTTGKILDLTGMGIQDLRDGIVRTAMDPNYIFAEDPLRMLRAIRFTVKYNWKLPLSMVRAIRQNANKITTISSERIQDEFNKMMLTKKPASAVRLMQMTGLTDHIMPELNKLVRLRQNKYHHEDAYKHSLRVLQGVPADLKTRLAALFHDIGKADTKTIVDGEIHFYQHEDVGADIAREIMKRLKYPNEVIDAVYTGIKNHMRLKGAGETGEVVSDKALRKLQKDLGDHLEMTLNVMDSDNRAHATGHTLDKQIPGVRQRLSTLQQPKEKSKLPVNGDDIMKHLGIKPGPIMKQLLAAVEDAWMENPDISPEDALKVAKSVYDKSSGGHSTKPDKIKNPETGNMIKLATALGYEKDHPARKEAEKHLDK